MQTPLTTRSQKKVYLWWEHSEARPYISNFNRAPIMILTSAPAAVAVAAMGMLVFSITGKSKSKSNMVANVSMSHMELLTQSKIRDILVQLQTVASSTNSFALWSNALRKRERDGTNHQGKAIKNRREEAPLIATVLEESTSMSMMKAIRGENSQTCALSTHNKWNRQSIFQQRIEAGSKRHTFGQNAHKKIASCSWNFHF